MKRNLSRLLALLLALSLCAVLAACGSSSSDTSGDSAEEPAAAVSDDASEAAEAEPAETETPEETSSVTKEDILAFFADLENGSAEGLNTYEASYDDMAAYLTEQGVISPDAEPVDMLTTEGYLTDNTGGSFATYAFADKAFDYDGVYLVWWDLAGGSETLDSYIGLKNNGVIVIMGGAALFENVSAYSGCYALGFAPDTPEDVVSAGVDVFSAIDSSACSLSYMTSAMQLITAMKDAGLIEASDIAGNTDLNSVYTYPTTTADWVGYEESEDGYGAPYDVTDYVMLASEAYQAGPVSVYYFDTLNGLYYANLDAVYDEVTASGTITPYCCLEMDGEWIPYTCDGTDYAEDGDVLTLTVDAVSGQFAISIAD